ncbi:hypothetical protein HZH66_007016 [Vespula vulgaris]|uniref:Uncharacterized protein n=1 Tax=Vespula vulgaris TaxID=7454 RepID=A0A834N5V8_VESVU|nr:hypothetical protein HZH66_007016 [Vespula vulgaris]
MLHELEEGTGSRRRLTTRMTKRNLAGPATVTATAAAAAAAGAAEAANSSNIGTSMRPFNRYPLRLPVWKRRGQGMDQKKMDDSRYKGLLQEKSKGNRRRWQK